MKRTVKAQIIYFILAIASSIIIVSCSKSGTKPNNTQAPVISSLSINSGPYYTEITIYGSGFSSVVTDDQLYFNGKSAVVEDPSATVMYTRVPLAAGTGPVTLTVKGITATGPVFNYQPAEVVVPFVGNDDTLATNGLGTVASFYGPAGLAIDAMNNIYVADKYNNMIRKVTPAGLVTTLAGNKLKGSADGIGVAASFSGPSGVAVDATGNVYVADIYNNLIRKITPAGVVSTFAGSNKGYTDGTGTAAQFNWPTDLVIDASGNLYVTDYYNYRIRKITPSGVVSTFAGSGSTNAKDGTGTSASFGGPVDIAIDDKTGNLYVTESDNLIRMITPDGVVTSIAGTSNGSMITSTFGMSQGLFVDKNGNLFIENSGLYQLDKLTSSGQLSIFAGKGNQQDVLGPITSANFAFMQGIVIDNSGNIYVTEDDKIRKITFE